MLVAMGTLGMQRNTSTYSLNEKIRLNLIKKNVFKNMGKGISTKGTACTKSNGEEKSCTFRKLQGICLNKGDWETVVEIQLESKQN